MDLDEIGNRIANLTFYDIKSAWTQAKNYALNISEIEAKVNEATSDDPWGASSTLMQEISQATNNFSDFNEIMPAIFRNFMEREANEWRQIYKSLQLLEYIVKHGSERVVDDARAHLSTIKILRNFHYIDEAGKDQGLNVRNRAKELSELLSDVDSIRQERKKARANRQKYQGVGNGDFVPGSGGGRYGGFGSDSYYAGGGGFPGGSGSTAGRYPSTSACGAHNSFDEYDAGEDDVTASSSGGAASSAGASKSASLSAGQKQPEQRVADLFSFDDDELAPPSETAASFGGDADALGDNFDDFQAAPSAAATTSASKTASAPRPAPAATAFKDSVFDLLDDSSAPDPTPAAVPRALGQAQGNGSEAASATLSPPLRPAMSSNAAASSVPSIGGILKLQTRASSSVSATQHQKLQHPSRPPSGLSGFDDLWSSSSGSSNKAANSGKKTMADLAKEQSGEGVWGASPSAKTQNASSAGGSGQRKDLFDLL